MASTYEKIATNTLGSAASSVTFSSISSAYTDLILVSNPKMTTTSTYFITTFNSDTATNYSQTRMSGNGTTAASARDTSVSGIDMEFQNSTDPGISIMQVQNYSNTTTYKTSLIRDNFAGYGVFARVALWRSTAAITSITLTMSSSTFAAGSQFTIYGIKAA